MRAIVVVTAAIAVLATACDQLQTETVDPALAPAGWATKSAAFVGVDGAETGRAAFAEAPGGVIIRVDITGLTTGWHGLHIHETADCSDGADGFQASGGHVNPDGFIHGLLNENGAHAADLTNVHAGEDGRAIAEIFRSGVDLAETEAGASQGHATLLDRDGFALIVHEGPDDHVAQPIGGAGARVACAAVRA